MNTISFPKMFNINTFNIGVKTSNSIRSINESLKSLLLTRPGELLGDPQYGCRLHEMLFDVKSNVNIYLVKKCICDAIFTYLPIIQVSDTTIKIYNNPNDGSYKITIQYIIQKYETIETFELVLFKKI